MDNILAFTDASFSKPRQVAVIGFRLHYDLYVHTQLISANNADTAEIIAIEFLLQFLSTYHPGHPVIIHSDNLIAINYIIGYYDIPPYISFKKIKGHTKGSDRTQLDRYMKSVDTYVRKELRQYLQPQNTSL